MVTTLELQRRGLPYAVVVDGAATPASLQALDRQGLPYLVEVADGATMASRRALEARGLRYLVPVLVDATPASKASLAAQGLRYAVQVDADILPADRLVLQRQGLACYVEVDSSGNSVSAAAVGGGALLTGETNGFAVDFTHAVNGERVAKKTAGAVVYTGTSFFTSSGTSSKWVYDVTGTLVNVPVGTLPLDYDPVTHAALGLRCEKAATNLLLNNAALSTQSVTVTAVAYTLSIFGTGTVTLSGTSTAGPLVGTGANNRVLLTFTPTAGSLTLTVSGSVTKGQLETGSVATSPIPTLGSTVTRATDIYSATAASIGTSGTAGSWWCEHYLQEGATDRVMILHDLATAIPLLYNTGGYLVREGTTFFKAGAPLNNLYRAMSAFQSGDRAVTFNGLAPATDAGATTNLLSPTTIYFGGATSNTAMTGWIRKLRYLPRRPTGAEMQTMTT